MTDSTKLAAARAYLVGLYGENPQGLLWIGGHADGWKGRTFTTPDAAATYAIELDARGGQGVYHRSTTLARRPEKRGEAEDSAEVFYFALDVDLQGPGHKATNLPATMQDATWLIEAAGFPPPTAWVHSGGGLYPQWRFVEPIDVREPARLAEVQEAFARISAHFIATARTRGWKLDNVRDLARVFRLPGTTNRKTDTHVVARAEDGAGGTYDLAGLTALCPAAAERPRESAPGAADDDPFDDVKDERRYTEAQAAEQILAQYAKMKEALGPESFNVPINAFAKFCSHFPWFADEERCAKNVDKALKAHGRSVDDNDYRATIASAYRSTADGRDWVAVKVEGPAPASEDGVPEVLPPPGRPLEAARELKGWIPASDGVPHRAWWQGDFYRWTGAHWEAEDVPVVEKWLYRQTGDAVYIVPPKKDGDDPERVPWAPTRKKIGDLAHALGVGELQHEGPEDRVVACANGVVSGRELVPHSPNRFNLFSLPFDYEPAAAAPAWLSFLEQVLPGDTEAQDFLGEWFGYVLSGRTEQQKMAALIGKKRSGKGTIARVLGALIGKENVSGLNLGLLSGTFGLEPFVGAALGVASDVRWHSRSIGDAIQVLLEVTGEDHITVHRKNKQAWKGQLGVRFMLMSNDTPTFSDRSGALVDRMLYVSFKQSFYGREDTGLTEKLMTELPGIFNWAMDGLDRLNSRGRFTQPESGREEADSTRRLADPIGAFVEDWCEVGPEQSITLDHLYLKYQAWCEGEGRTRDTTTKEIFSRDLRAKIDGLVVDRTRIEGRRTRVLKGIGSTEM